ncbi:MULTISPECIES: aminoacyl-tRNA deacylase [Vibrio oreintalis group]|uniref:aminoacyl-tRNA deacylase n=1 Tax=Vibrio oreintalis group TaxID=1891919 RepID=UPI002341EBD4|nr:YbaK/EbsC family protein [Vibrio europaeus]MDC5852358.1 YbaK/EbsC family protein [Vibrio europaeus]
MSIANRLDHYLNEHNIPFQTVQHSHSQSSLQSGVAAGIPLVSLAKGIVLEDHDGHHMMAVLPAKNKISLSRLNEELNASFHLVKEKQLYEMFEDCENGAVPPVGSAYHISMTFDEVLTRQNYVYLEAGDHETLIKLDQESFQRLMGESRMMRFSSELFH